MPWSRESRREKVQIDTDWLLGPAPQGKGRRNHRPTKSLRTRGTRSLALAGLVVLTAGVVWKWEVASHEVLRWQWSRLLSKDETTEETLAALVALSDSMDDADGMLLEQLRSQRGHRRTVAFQLLKNRTEQRAGKQIPEDQRRTAVSMLKSFDQQDRELMMMRGWLASRLLSCVSADDPSSRTDREALLAMIGDASASDLAHQRIAAASTTAPAGAVTLPMSNATALSQKLAMPSLPPLPDKPPHQPPVSWSPETTTAWASNALRDAPSESSFGAAMRLSDEASSDQEPSGLASGVPAQNASMASVSRQATKLAGTEPMKRSGTEPIKRAGTEPIRSELIAPMSAADVKYEVRPVPRNLQSVAGESGNEVAGSMRGLGKLGTDQVMRLLESTQDRLVAQAVSELEARGLKPQHVELAMELARGSSSERLAAMEKIAGEPDVNAIPWLVWMAEAGDREVRMRAISMLGATADDEALRKLRLLKQREIDNRVADQITQVLLAAGSAHSSNR